MCRLLADDVIHDVKCVRDASARALAAAIAVHPDNVQDTMTSLLSVFEEKLYVSEANIQLKKIKIFHVCVFLNRSHLPSLTVSVAKYHSAHPTSGQLVAASV